MVTAESNEIVGSLELTNAAGIAHMWIALPKAGIVVVEGPNGCGKSVGVLGGLQKTLGGNQKLTKRDGTVGNGSVKLTTPLGCVTLTLGDGGTRRTGEAGCISIEDSLSLQDLIDPIGVKTPVAADRLRTKALCRLTEAEADPSLFYNLVGGKDAFTALVKPKTLAKTDLVDLQEGIKRDFEEHKRLAAESAATARGAADVCKAAIEGIDLTVESDPVVLQTNSNQAVEACQAVKDQLAEAVRADEEAASARELYDDAQANYDGPTSEQTLGRAQAAGAGVKGALEAADAAEETLRRCKEHLARCRTALDLADAAHRLAVQHEVAIAKWTESVRVARDVEMPTAEEIGKAKSAKEAANAANLHGGMVREALVKADEYDKHKATAAHFDEESERLHIAAGQSEKILAEAIKIEGLSLVDGRWVVEMPGRGEVFFHDLSKGERGCRCITWVAIQTRSRGVEMVLIPIPQPIWEGIDYDGRCLLYVKTLELKVLAFTAQCDANVSGGKLRADLFKPRERVRKKGTANENQ